MNLTNRFRFFHAFCLLVASVGVGVPSLCRAATPSISNVRVSQPEHSRELRVDYDLVCGNESNVVVSLNVSTNNGSSWFEPSVQNLRGDVGVLAFSSETRRTIFWEGEHELPQVCFSAIRAKVVLLTTREVAWFRMDDNGDDRMIADSSSQDVAATNLSQLTSQRAAEGLIGGALLFKSNEYAVSLSPKACDALSSTNFTVAFWAKRATTAVHCEFFKMRQSDAGENICYFNKDYSHMLWHWYVTNALQVNAVTDFPPNTWTHWAFVRSGTNFFQFKNGTKVVEAHGNPMIRVKDICLGGRGNNYNNTRTLDDFRIISSALSTNEIASLYRSGAGSDQSLGYVSSYGAVSPTAVYDLAQHVVVDFDVNGGEGALASVTGTLGAAYGLLPVPTKLGYHLVAWQVCTGDVPVTVTSETIISIATNHTLTALWAANTYWAFFAVETNGPCWQGVRQQVTFDAPYGPLPHVERLGYTFVNWECRTGGVPFVVTEDTRVSIPADHTVFSRWSIVTCTVTLNARGGQVEPFSRQVRVNAPYGELPIPTRTGFIFVNWLADAGDGPFAVTGETHVSIPTNHTLTACWTPVPYATEVLSRTGAYDGYFYTAEDMGNATNSIVRGSLSLSVTSLTGRFTGIARTQYGTFVFKSSVWDDYDEDGTAIAITKAKSGETLILYVRQNLIWGSLSGGVLGKITFQLEGARNRFREAGDAEAQALLAACEGSYTLALPLNQVHSQGAATAAPQGVGYLTLKIGDGGSAKVAGVLADGTSLSLASHVLAMGDDEWVCVPLFASLYSNNGWTGGLLWINLEDRRMVTFTSPENRWLFRWEKARGTPADFVEFLNADGGAYEPDFLSACHLFFSASVNAVPYFSPVGPVAPVAEAMPCDIHSLWMTPPFEFEPGVSPTFSDGRYDYSGPNSSLATMRFSGETGVFRGSFYVYYDYLYRGLLRHVKVRVQYSGVVATVHAPTCVYNAGLGHCLVPDSDPVLKAYRIKRSSRVELLPMWCLW